MSIQFAIIQNVIMKNENFNCQFRKYICESGERDNQCRSKFIAGAIGEVGNLFRTRFRFFVDIFDQQN